jgi:hypothetical protein
VGAGGGAEEHRPERAHEDHEAGRRAEARQQRDRVRNIHGGRNRRSDPREQREHAIQHRRGGTAPPGFVNLCRREAIPFNPDETAFAASIALGLGNLLKLPDAQDLERQPAKPNRGLESRKLIDRAKGILQDRFGLSENDAYFRMRRTSRKRRKPMGEIALLVIDSGFVPEVRERERK